MKNSNQLEKLEKKDISLNNSQSDSSVENNSGSSTNKGITIRFRKRTLFIIISILLLICLTGTYVFTSTRTLSGTWVRLSDDSQNEGMRVRASKESGAFQGIVVDASTSVFETGQVKWNSIRRIGWGKYECRDLTYSGNYGNYYYDSDSSSVITISLDGKTMQIITTGDTENRVGNYQNWVKE